MKLIFVLVVWRCLHLASPSKFFRQHVLKPIKSFTLVTASTRTRILPWQRSILSIFPPSTCKLAVIIKPLITAALKIDASHFCFHHISHFSFSHHPWLFGCERLPVSRFLPLCPGMTRYFFFSHLATTISPTPPRRVIRLCTCSAASTRNCCPRSP